MSLKMLSKQQWVVVILLGLLLVVIAMPVSKKDDASDVTEGVNEGFALTAGADSEVETTALESRLRAVLGDMEGVGQVQVMIYTSQTSGLASAEAGEIRGVLIVAEGADDSVTEREIQEAVMALFQLEAHKIKVMNMK